MLRVSLKTSPDPFSWPTTLDSFAKAGSGAAVRAAIPVKADPKYRAADKRADPKSFVLMISSLRALVMVFFLGSVTLPKSKKDACKARGEEAVGTRVGIPFVVKAEASSTDNNVVQSAAKSPKVIFIFVI